MGGAGVAHSFDASATYWNPGGLAFYEKPFSTKFNLGAGIGINSGLANNADKLDKLDFNSLNDLNASGKADTSAALKSAGDAVQLIGIIKDIDQKGGALGVTPAADFAFQYRNFGVGAFMGSEMTFYVNSVDTVNILPANSNTNLTTFASDIGATSGRPVNQVFSLKQYSEILSAFSNNSAVVDTLERQLATSNTTGLSSDQLAQSLVDLGKTFSSSGSNSIDNNTTSLALRGLVVTEIPVGYGHKLDLKEFGELGIGGAVKVMMGTTYGEIISLTESKGSNNVFKKIDDAKADSTSFGVDLGVVWRKKMPFIGQSNVGLVAKNLNSPEFDNPQGFAGKTKVEPQLRAGVAIDPFEWLSVAADMDLTKNKSLAQGLDTQNFGFGAEVKPFGWVAFRGGIMANTVSSGSTLGTFGLSLGPKWLRLDVDGAVSFESAIFDNKSYPREAKVEFGLSTMF